VQHIYRSAVAQSCERNGSLGGIGAL